MDEKLYDTICAIRKNISEDELMLEQYHSLELKVRYAMTAEQVHVGACLQAVSNSNAISFYKVVFSLKQLSSFPV